MVTTLLTAGGGSIGECAANLDPIGGLLLHGFELLQSSQFCQLGSSETVHPPKSMRPEIAKTLDLSGTVTPSQLIPTLIPITIAITKV